MSLARDIADLASVTTRLDTVGASSGALSNRNMLANGAMKVAQRSTSVTGIGASAGYFTVDRIKLNAALSGGGRLTASQSTDGPVGFGNSLKLACTTADTSLAAGEYFIIQNISEGQDVQSMGAGFSDAKEVTISFYCKANASLTFCVNIYKANGPLHVAKLFTVGTSWQRVSITFPADTAGSAIANDNVARWYTQIWIAAGSSYTSGTLATTWTSYSAAATCAGIDNFFSSTSNEFYLTGLQLEVGDTATDFEHRSFGDELARCQRYYSREEAATGAAYKRYATGSWSSTTGFECLIPLSTPLRTTPTLETTGTASNYAIYSANAVDALTSLAITNDADAGTDNRAVAVAVTTSSGGVSGEGGTLLGNNNTDNFLALDAEL